jgi:hypothetical protein
MVTRAMAKLEMGRSAPTAKRRVILGAEGHCLAWQNESLNVQIKK